MSKMNEDRSEATGDKQVLEYYNLFGRDRDIKQYLTLPSTTDLNRTNDNIFCGHSLEKAQELKHTSDIEENANINSEGHTEELVNKIHLSTKSDNINDGSHNKKALTSDKIAAGTSKIKFTEKAHGSKHDKGKQRELILNVESQIEINYETDIPLKEEARQVKFDKMPPKTKSILKTDDIVRQRGQKHIELVTNNENNITIVSPTSSVNSNRRHTISPTSSLASNRRLEWDSLADVGYNNNEELFLKYPLSTLERIALEQRQRSQHKPQDLKASNTVDKYEEHKIIPIVTKSVIKMHKSIGKPTAESTPLVPKIDQIESLEQNLVSRSNDKKMDHGHKNISGTKKLHKSLDSIDVKETIQKADKHIQTSLPRNSTLKTVLKDDERESCEDESDKISLNSKENITKHKTPVKNKYRSRMLRRQRISRRKLASSTPFSINCEEEDSSPNLMDKVNTLEVLKGDSRFNISQSSIGTNFNSIARVNENGTRAESFEFVPGEVYHQKTGQINDNMSNKVNSDVGASLKRSKKLEDVTSISTSRSNDSLSTKINKESSNGTDNKSSFEQNLFDESKYTTLSRDIKISVKLLNALMANNKGNLELKKRFVRKVAKRLLEANYGDESSAVESSVNVKDSQSSTVIHSSINSTSKSFSTSTSPDPSYSLPEHLIANVPWQPSKFSQGIDYIRLPGSLQHQNANIHQNKPKLKSIYTTKHDDKYSSTSTSGTLGSFNDLTKKSTRSPQKMKKMNEQQKIINEKLLRQQITSEVKQSPNMDSSSGLVSYVKREKQNQISWINSEIEHLCYLKTLLENQGRDKVDSLEGSHKVSARGDNKFDQNFFSEFGNVPNRNIVYPLITDIDKNEEEAKNEENVAVVQSGTSKHQVEEKKSLREEESITKVEYERVKYTRSKNKDVQDASRSNSSSSSSFRASIREQIKQLSRNIELLKQSTRHAKSNSSSIAHGSRLSYTEWDSHANISRPYSEIIYIHESKNSERSRRPILKSTDESKVESAVSTESKIKTKDNVGHKEKDGNVEVSKSDKIETSQSSSDTHTSLKSGTISLENVPSKSTEQSGTSVSVDPGWEMYMKRKFDLKPEVQHISTQTSDSLSKKDDKKSDEVKRCANCKRSVCKCSKKVGKKIKEPPKPVAYVLTFENESTPSSSAKNSRKPSLDEMKVKIPYVRENKKKDKSRKLKKDEVKASKARKNEDISQSSDHALDIGESSEIILQNIDSQENLPISGGDSKSSKSSDSSTQTLTKSTDSVSESTLVSTSTDSFIMEDKNKGAEKSEKEHKPTIQECLMIYKPGFLRKAEKRRQIIQKIAELRSQRNVHRKQLLQLITDDPEVKKEIDIKIKKILPQPKKPQRIFTSKEIRDMSRKKYKHLPEITQKKRDALRDNLYRNNRFIASIFNKKLQKHVLQGKLTLSHSMTVVNE